MRETRDLSVSLKQAEAARAIHPWLRTSSIAFVPGSMTPLLERVSARLLESLRLLGHQVQATPDASTDAILTTARFGEVTNWSQALIFSARRRFSLARLPVVFTLVHATQAGFLEVLNRLEAALSRENPNPEDYAFPGLAPKAYSVLHEQGRRGGSLLALSRLVQAQAKSVRVILVIGDDRPAEAYHFDLVGAHPRTAGSDEEFFYRDVALRIITAISTREATDHQVVGDPIPYEQWRCLDTPAAMRVAAEQFETRGFFSKMVWVSDLVQVPAVGEALARQYSEGSFSTWDPKLHALVVTATGSAHPVNKGNISDDNLSVVVGIRPDGRGALVRVVEGKENVPPSSEALEMAGIDQALPWVKLSRWWGLPDRVPVVRSKLHGHRGIAAYDPRRVEYAALEPSYQYYPVSCATEAQAQGIIQAFSRSEAFRHPEDPRRVVFTVLPGHGVLIGEKWTQGKAPFQIIWEYMDAGFLTVANRVPQGLTEYIRNSDGRMRVQTP